MRVLWFANTPSLGAAYLNSDNIGGGWIESLEAELTKTKNIQLGIAFNFNIIAHPPFSSGNTTYYPLPTDHIKNKVNKIYHRWKHTIEDTVRVQLYLDVIEKYKPDIIHIFGTESDFGLITAYTSIPCIIHLQGNITVCTHKWFQGI
jgi:hypothetical protein